MAQQKRHITRHRGKKETSGGSGRTASGDSGGTASGSQTSEEEGEQEYVQYLEKKLENILMQMDGVGRVDVMITVSDGGEQIVEKDKRQLPLRRASVIPEAGSAV